MPSSCMQLAEKLVRIVFDGHIGWSRDFRLCLKLMADFDIRRVFELSAPAFVVGSVFPRSEANLPHGSRLPSDSKGR